jgi:hypothetical protein
MIVMTFSYHGEANAHLDFISSYGFPEPEGLDIQVPAALGTPYFMYIGIALIAVAVLLILLRYLRR